MLGQGPISGAPISGISQPTKPQEQPAAPEENDTAPGDRKFIALGTAIETDMAMPIRMTKSGNTGEAVVMPIVDHPDDEDEDDFPFPQLPEVTPPLVGSNQAVMDAANQVAINAANARRRTHPAILSGVTDPLGPLTVRATGIVDTGDQAPTIMLDAVTLEATANVEPSLTATLVRGPRNKALRIEQDYDQLLLMAMALGRMARDEITRIDGERPNDPTTIVRQAKERELLEIFAEGFEQLAAALAAFAQNKNEPLLLGIAAKVVNSVGDRVNEWCGKNGADAAGWSMKLSFMTAGIAALGWAGADMTIATAAVTALVGGKEVADAIRGGKDE